jgi:hypothetical protein
MNSRFLGAFFIHQSIKEKISEISESKTEFLKYRDLIFFELLDKVKNADSIVLERICFSVSILISVGLITFWLESIEDIVKYAKLSRENCYIAVVILQNIFKELNEIKISGKKLLKIKDTLIEKNIIVGEFIFLLLEDNYINKNIDEKISKKKNFFGQILELLNSWLRLGLNILLSPQVINYLFLAFNSDTADIISEIFSESISTSKSAKLFFTKDNYDLNNLLNFSEPAEIESIGKIIDFIEYYLYYIIFNNNNINISHDNFFKQIILKEKISKEEKLQIVLNIENILTSIIENYTNLLFMKNNLSTKILNLFYMLITKENKKISAKLFMPFNEIKEFINKYQFNNYDFNEKKEFCDFLLRIMESVMKNSKVSNIFISTLAEKKFITSVDDLEIIDPNDKLIDNSEMPSQEYRKQAEEIFYDIFTIFFMNFKDEGVEYFLKFLSDILDQSCLINNNDKGNSNSNLNLNFSDNDPRIYIIEVVFLVLNSIAGCFEVAENYIKYLNIFTTKIFLSQISQSEKLICPFLKFVDVASPFIAKDENLLHISIKIFSGLIQYKQFEYISSLFLLQITEFSNFVSKENFEFLYEIFLREYDNFALNTIGNFVEILSNSVALKENSNSNFIENINDIDNDNINFNKNEGKLIKFSKKEIIFFFKKILEPANQRIIKTYEILEENIRFNNNNNNININNFNFTELNSNINKDLIEKIISSFYKNFKVFNIMLKKCFFLNKDILLDIFYNMMNNNNTAKILEISMKFFIYDTNYIKENSRIFLKLSTNIQEEILPYFDYINELMLYLYVNNPENFYCLNVLKPLYSNGLNFSLEKKQYISNNFFKLSEIIKKNILEVNKNNKLDIIILLCGLWNSVLNSVDFLYIDIEENLYSFLDFILDAFRTVCELDLNKSIIRLLSTLISTSGILIPKQIFYNKFVPIVNSIYGYLDNLNSNSMPVVIN